MLTGLFPRHHKLIMNGMALPESVPTLPDLLGKAGYRTHGVGKQHLQPLLAPRKYAMPDSRAFWELPESRGWSGPYYGYETLDLLLGESDTAHLAGHYAKWLKQNHPDSIPLLEPHQGLTAVPKDLDEIWCSAMPVDHHYNTWITNQAVNFIQRQEEENPYFLFVSYPDPHHPFDPPKHYADRYDPEQMPLPEVSPDERARMPAYYGELYPKGQGFRELYWAGRMDMEAGSMITTDEISDRSMQTAIAYTYAMIEMIDDGVGQILTALRHSHRADNTYVVFTSDHGELLGDHGLLHKGPPPYRQLTEVSMLMRGPDIPQGTVIDGLTNHIDLAPTLLDFAGVGSGSVEFDGASMAPMLNSRGVTIRDYNFGEYHPSVKPELYNQTVSTERWRYTHYPQNSSWGELFDLVNDPAERNNLFGDSGYDRTKKELSAVLKADFPAMESVENELLCKW